MDESVVRNGPRHASNCWRSHRMILLYYLLSRHPPTIRLRAPGGLTIAARVPGCFIKEMARYADANGAADSACVMHQDVAIFAEWSCSHCCLFTTCRIQCQRNCCFDRQMGTWCGGGKKKGVICLDRLLRSAALSAS